MNRIEVKTFEDAFEVIWAASASGDKPPPSRVKWLFWRFFLAGADVCLERLCPVEDVTEDAVTFAFKPDAAMACFDELTEARNRAATEVQQGHA